ncbi:hypothetical protein ASD23_03235 [Agromyces sp. Root1464]|uniref:DUF402 domain-containing protein n=1 Tax=Agromyces sp. Root1464 TaxID=1736467 RepID=UPI0006F487FC|nr:DUF402 domain-containing protein [Agromyces sp. Root1464]KQZ11130.1 hypothetical protein ASD23_03235 [Agromyces sp. Root1464]
MSAADDRPRAPGDLVRVRATKWLGQPHWEFDGRWLGADEHGDWVGFPAGTRFARPGHGFTATWDSVSLFPRAGWAAGFNAGHPRGLGIYVDLATVPEWRADASGAWTVSYVDLDLDVVERTGAPAFIDDEDEFAEHAVQFGYPAELVARARADAEAVLGAVRRREAPFDGATAAGWLGQLGRLGDSTAFIRPEW